MSSKHPHLPSLGELKCCVLLWFGEDDAQQLVNKYLELYLELYFEMELELYLESEMELDSRLEMDLYF